MLSPLPRRSGWAYCFAHTSPSRVSLPDMAVGSACALSFSRLARRSLALRPAHSRCHRISWLAIRRLQPLRYLHSCSGCFRLERSPGGPCTHWKAPPFHGARQQQTHASQQTTSSLNHLVSSRQQCRWHRHAHPNSGLEVDHQFEFGCLFDWDIGDLAAAEELEDLSG